MVSLAHGTNDAQKTMGIITLALITNHTLPPGASAPDWVIVSCALAISVGTYLGGWRVIRTLGKGLVEIDSPQGMAAESASAAVILLSASFGYSLSTTHVATGSIIGTGLGKKGADVRWNVAGRMATAWLFTLPCAAVVGAGAEGLTHAIGGTAGRHRRPCHPRRDRAVHLLAVARHQGGPRERQRRVDRIGRPGGRPEPRDLKRRMSNGQQEQMSLDQPLSHLEDRGFRAARWGRAAGPVRHGMLSLSKGPRTQTAGADPMSSSAAASSA